MSTGSNTQTGGLIQYKCWKHTNTSKLVSAKKWGSFKNRGRIEIEIYMHRQKLESDDQSNM